MAAGTQIIVRLISSEDHIISKKDLLQTIRDTGTDRYDKDKKQVFDYFYGPHRVEFFSTIVEEADVEDAIKRMKDEFGAKTLGDRQKFVTPDIAILYKADECDMVQHVYEERLTSDCFRFRKNPKSALIEVREV